MEFEAVIGLEVHAQLNTKTKIFCGCRTDFGANQNTQVCPVCMGLPGALPVLNQIALNKAILAGLATNCEISKYSKFDRKNYFYPDLPKAYQISQYDKPICKNGYVSISSNESEKSIRLNRIHLEEDAGKNIHSDDFSKKVSYVDYNRSCVPLIEIVTEPDISSGEEAYSYLTGLKQILKYIDVSDCNMEEGSLRCDVNISVRPKGETKLGTKVEVKNLNSFKAVKAAIDYEKERQIDSIIDKEKIIQETRLWDADKQKTYSMRSKEEAHDYRYFPDPDLPPVVLNDEYIGEIRKLIPELPENRKNRFVESFNISVRDAEILTSIKQIADYFEECLKFYSSPKKIANWIISELLAHVEDAEKIKDSKVKPESLAKLISLIDSETINGKIAKTVFEEIIRTGDDPDKIIKEKGLKQVTDTTEIESVIDAVLKENGTQVDEYKNGKTKVVGFLVGQVMKASKGKANPKIVNDILIKKLGG